MLATVLQAGSAVSLRPLVKGRLTASRASEREQSTSPSQQRLWFLHQLEPHNPTWHLLRVLRISGRLEIDRLNRAWTNVLGRFDVLRSNFTCDHAGEVRQRVADSTRPALRIDESAVDQIETRVEEIAREEMRRPFNLTSDRLVRGQLVRVSPDDHALIVTAHRIVCDDASLDQFVTELTAYYGVGALSSNVGTLGRSSNGDTSSFALAARLAYWKTQLADELPILELPTVGPRPAIQTHNGARQRVRIGRKLVTALEKLAAANGATLDMTLLAAWNILLHRHSNQSQVVVGVQYDMRQPGEYTIGPLTDTLVIRTDLSGDPSFLDTLDRVRITQSAAQTHFVPLAMLISATQPKRDLGRMPLFQATFAFDSHAAPPPPHIDARNIRIKTADIDPGVAEMDVALRLHRTSDGIDGWLTYNRDLFDLDATRRMARHYVVLLEGIVADPRAAVSVLPILQSCERRKLIDEWNRTDAPLPQGIACVHQLFEAQAQRVPDKVAIRFRDHTITYARLNARANQLARHLQSLGIAADSRVAICVDRSIEMVVALLAVLKSGAAYVPMDPGFPAERLAYMLSDSAASIILTQESLLPHLPQRGENVRTLCLDTDWPSVVAHESDADVNAAIQLESVAHIIYTSGSTGTPNGVQILRRGLLNVLWSIQRWPGMTQEDVLLAVSTISFDIAGLEMLLPLISGAQILLADRATASDGRELRELLEQSDATLMQATPATWRMLVEVGWQRRPGKPLKIFCGGEALSRELARAMQERNCEVYDLYGPSETTIYSTGGLVEDRDGLVPIGRPLPNTRAYILDGKLQPVPIGVTGELYLGGMGLARGYLNKPELTAQRFLPDPFDSTPGARMYKTGDLTRYRNDGTIEYLGRSDHQIKIRGFRIELGEIESVLLQQPSVRQAVVCAKTDPTGDKHLVGYVVLDSPSPVDSLRDALAARLPQYMVPSAIIPLDRFPMTPNGKVDRKALPEINAATGVSRQLVPPRDHLEHRLTQIWQQTLGVDSIGITDDFFDLGGHSLKAVSLCVQIQKELGRMLPLAILFQAPTIEQLAARLREGGSQSPSSSPMVLIQRGTDESRPPLFCLPGAGGHCVAYRALVAHLPPELTVYGFNLKGLDGQARPHSRIEDMAGEFLDLVREAQPTGPYHLVGYSLGGWTALEMARLLRQRGEEIGLLLLIDSWGKDYPRVLSPMQRVGVHWRNFAAGDLRHKVIYAADRVRNVRRKLSRELHRAKRKCLAATGVNATAPDVIADVNEATWKAMKGYDPRPYDGPATLLRAAVTPEWPGSCFDDTRNGWGETILGGLDVRQIPCRHLEMFEEPHASRLAGELLRSLAGPELSLNTNRFSHQERSTHDPSNTESHSTHRGYPTIDDDDVELSTGSPHV